MSTTDVAAEPAVDARWLAFAAVCVGYLATTLGESLASPIFPIAADDVGFDTEQAGYVFAVLAGSIAVANLTAGVLLRWIRANVVLAVAVVAGGAGNLLAASADGSGQFLIAQIFIGAGAGLLYPAAIMAIGVFAGPERRGLAMGIFGVAFSGGLALAALLAALNQQLGWRGSFVLTAVMCLVAFGAVVGLRDSPKSRSDTAMFSGLRLVLGTPSAVGVVGGISQYATVSFLPVFAVAVWDTSAAVGAAALAVGRVLSVPSKLVSGSIADRRGPEFTARLLGACLAVSGIVWALSPSQWFGMAAAALFAALVSGLFPLANLLAFNRVGRRGGALGAFRSLQLGAGAVAGFVVASTSDAIGLRPTVAVAATLPLLLLLVRDAD